jgi:hypothetical protein
MPSQKLAPMLTQWLALLGDATPIDPGEQTITVFVSARWGFVVGQVPSAFDSDY